MGKGYFAKHIIVVIVGHNIAGIRGNGTIYELIVIWIGLYQMETVEGRDKFRERAVDYRFKYQLRNFVPSKAL